MRLSVCFEEDLSQCVLSTQQFHRRSCLFSVLPGGASISILAATLYQCAITTMSPLRRIRTCTHRWTPESVGDYASGTNHVLPTYGYARMYSGVSLDSFTKKMTVQNLSYEGLQVLGPHVAKMAEVEGLDAHKRAVTLRLESSN